MLLRATECGPERPVSAAVAALIGWVFGWAKNKKRSAGDGSTEYYIGEPQDAFFGERQVAAKPCVLKATG